jgi:DNA polymerase/3'-5' exonuclease PolX
MNKTNDFSYIKVKNLNNKYIVDVFIDYYTYIYSNYTNYDTKKTSKEIYYKLATIKKVIDIVSKFNKQIFSGEELQHIKGIGPKTIARINEIINTGTLSEIVNNKNKFDSISELSKIYGIGPTKASQFYNNFNIKSIDELIKANNKGIIKLTKQMKLGIKYKNSLVEKIPHELIKLAENTILNKIKSSDKKLIAIICGSFRRNKPFSSDLDILLTHPNINHSNNKQSFYLNKVIDVLNDFFIIDKLTLSSSRHFQGFASFKNIVKSFPDFDTDNSVIRIDIIIVPFTSFYTALLHFTGSAVFNQKIRLHAKSLNMKLSEYFLIKHSNNKDIHMSINSEKDIFDALLLKYIPPDKR